MFVLSFGLTLHISTMTLTMFCIQRLSRHPSCLNPGRKTEALWEVVFCTWQDWKVQEQSFLPREVALGLSFLLCSSLSLWPRQLYSFCAHPCHFGLGSYTPRPRGCGLGCPESSTWTQHWQARWISPKWASAASEHSHGSLTSLGLGFTLAQWITIHLGQVQGFFFNFALLCILLIFIFEIIPNLRKLQKLCIVLSYRLCPRFSFKKQEYIKTSYIFVTPVHHFFTICHTCYIIPYPLYGFPGGSVVKNLPANTGDEGSIPGLGRTLKVGKWQPTPVFLPGGFHEQKSLAISVPGLQSNMIEQITFSLFSYIYIYICL